MDNTVRTALVNEARRQQAAQRLEGLRGRQTLLGELAQVVATLARDTAQEVSDAAQQVSALAAGAGPGLTDEFGEYSSVDQLLRRERFAGKRASLEHVHAHPQAAEAEALDAWRTAALAETGLPTLLQDPAAMGALYRSNLKASGAVLDTTWEAQRAWILARTVDEAMGL